MDVIEGLARCAIGDMIQPVVGVKLLGGGGTRGSEYVNSPGASLLSNIGCCSFTGNFCSGVFFSAVWWAVKR